MSSINIQQAITVTGFFQQPLGGNVDIEKKFIKRLSNEQKNICYEAFKILKDATLKDLETPNPNALDKSIIEAIKTSLDAPLGPDEAEPAWYAKPFYFIAHKINSLAKGIANIFWRTGSGALSNKVAAYRNDVNNYRQELISYRYETETVEGKKKPAYFDSEKRIEEAKKNYTIEVQSVEELERLCSLFCEINNQSRLENVKKKRAERTNLTTEDSYYIGRKNLKIKTLSEIVVEVIKNEPAAGVETEILKKLQTKAKKNVDDDRKEASDKNQELKNKHIDYFTKEAEFDLKITQKKELKKQYEDSRNNTINKLHFETQEKINKLKKNEIKSCKNRKGAEVEEIKKQISEQINAAKESCNREEVKINTQYMELIIKEEEKIKPELDMLYEYWQNEIYPLKIKYENEQRDLEENLEAARIIKAKKDNKQIADQIKIAIEKLDHIYNTKVSAYGTLPQVTARYEAAVKENIHMKNTEKLLKIKFPQLADIGK